MLKIVWMYFIEVLFVNKVNVYNMGNIYYVLEINFINIFKIYILIYIINCFKVFVGFFYLKEV